MKPVSLRCRCCSRAQPWPGPALSTAALLPGIAGATCNVDDENGPRCDSPYSRGFVLLVRPHAQRMGVVPNNRLSV